MRDLADKMPSTIPLRILYLLFILSLNSFVPARLLVGNMSYRL